MRTYALYHGLITTLVGMHGVTWVEWLFIEAINDRMSFPLSPHDDFIDVSRGLTPHAMLRLTICDKRDCASKDLVRCAHRTFY